MTAFAEFEEAWSCTPESVDEEVAEQLSRIQEPLLDGMLKLLEVGLQQRQAPGISETLERIGSVTMEVVKAGCEHVAAVTVRRNP